DHLDGAGRDLRVTGNDGFSGSGYFAVDDTDAQRGQQAGRKATGGTVDRALRGGRNHDFFRSLDFRAAADFDPAAGLGQARRDRQTDAEQVGQVARIVEVLHDVVVDLVEVGTADFLQHANR